jgi:Fur family transcriptional regulator, iron response regulator
LGAITWAQLDKVEIPFYNANMELHNHSRESVAQLLRSHGISPTHQRIEIGFALFDNPQHPSADEILAMVNARNTETSKATVYNTLKLFVEKGLAREVIVDPNKVFYDPNTSAHHHFYDVATGELTDIPADGVSVEGLPPLPMGTVSAGIEIIVRTRTGP